MENQPLSKNTVAFGLSLALCSVLNALLVVIKEKSPAVAAAMKQMTGHHWVTHSALVVVLFLLCGWSLARLNVGQGLRLAANRLIGIVVAGVLAGGLIIMGFYLIAD
ncbi:MAG: hypothetical protein ABSH48_02520 [Verrucomicrobiota bacterium]|jgi:hypothetical protein